MIKAPISLQDLRRRIYLKAKAEKPHRFWGLYAHICKMETLKAAYKLAKKNDGAPGIDEVTFEAIEKAGSEEFLGQIQKELTERSYLPGRFRKHEIPKGGGKVRVLLIPTIRDRVVQGAVKLILEPIFEADFQEGSYGYRPKRRAREAIEHVANQIARNKLRVIDVDLEAFFDNIQHQVLLEKVARRVSDGDVLHVLKLILKATGKQGVPQGGVISPLLANIYLNEVDCMLERAKEVTRKGKYTHVEYARYADDLVILVDAYRKHQWLIPAVWKRLQEELDKLGVKMNEEKSRVVDLTKAESFGFLGFDFRCVQGEGGKWRPWYTPKQKKRKDLLRKVKETFRRYKSQPIDRVVHLINPILRGWTNYFRAGDSRQCFSYVRNWIEKKVRRHLSRAQGRKGFGWKRWSREWLYEQVGLFGEYQLDRFTLRPKAVPAG